MSESYIIVFIDACPIRKAINKGFYRNDDSIRNAVYNNKLENLTLISLITNSGDSFIDFVEKSKR